MDGPPDIHNTNRPLKTGGGSFDTVIKSYRFLSKLQGGCGAIATVTRKTLGREHELVEFFRSIGIKNWHSNHYVYDRCKPNRNEDFAITSNEFAEYFKRQLDAYIAIDDTSIHMSNLLYFLKGLTGLESTTLCTYGGRCITNFVNIDPNGNAALCPKFMGDKKHILGNIADSSLSWIMGTKNPKIRRLLKERLEHIRKCEEKKCRWTSLCHFGCPYTCSLNSPKSSIAAEDALCEGKQKIFQMVDERLRSYKVTTTTCISFGKGGKKKKRLTTSNYRTIERAGKEKELWL